MNKKRALWPKLRNERAEPIFIETCRAEIWIDDRCFTAMNMRDDMDTTYLPPTRIVDFDRSKVKDSSRSERNRFLGVRIVPTG